MNIADHIKNIYTFLILICPLLWACPGKKQDPEPQKIVTKEEVMEAWATEVYFEPREVSVGQWSYKDIVFNKGVGALLDNDNRVFYTHDNGTTWTEKLKITAATLKSIALKPDGEKL